MFIRKQPHEKLSTRSNSIQQPIELDVDTPVPGVYLCAGTRSNVNVMYRKTLCNVKCNVKVTLCMFSAAGAPYIVRSDKMHHNIHVFAIFLATNVASGTVHSVAARNLLDKFQHVIKCTVLGHQTQIV